MGNKNGSHENIDPDSNWKEQNMAIDKNPMYKFANINKTGRLAAEYKEYGRDKVIETIKKEIEPYYLYKRGGGSTITKQEYCQWYYKDESKPETLQGKQSNGNIKIISGNQVDESKMDGLSTFKQHEACWILNRRGAVGETPFHLCYLMGTPDHTEVAKIFLELYPKMALDIYEGNEYYGESCLHIAIVYGDMEAVKLLVEKGADVNQRATGQFFLPEDVKAGKSISKTNYEGYAYYGEYPLAFAACFNNQEIYDYLIAKGADPDKQDSFGNTVLHMVVIADQPKMYKHAVKHLKRKADSKLKNKADLTPLTLASKLGRHRIFSEMLELSSLDMWKYSNIACSMYPLHALDSIGFKGEANWNSALMIIVDGTTDEHLDMLQGGVIRQLLDEKWKTFARKIFTVRLVIAIFHLGFLSVAVYTRPVRESLLTISGPKDIARVTCEIFTCLFCVCTLVVEWKEICPQGFSSSLKNIKHAPDQTVYIMSCILILLCIPFRFLSLPDVEDTFLTLAVPGAFFYLLFFARGIRTTGPFVTMIYQMCTHDLLKFGVVYFIFLLGFTQGFYFLFRDVETDNTEVLKFATPWETVLNLFQMTLGEFKYETFNYARYVGLTKFLFTIFMILVPILLLNMLIAMMGNTYHNINTKSEKEWRRQWAKIVIVLERSFTKSQLLKYQEEYSICLSDPNSEVAERALVVIKAASKSSAKQSKAAKINWKRITKLVIVEWKRHKSKGSKKPFTVKKFRKKYEKEYNRVHTACSLVKKQSAITSMVEQMAWVNLDESKSKQGDREGEARQASPMMQSPHKTLPDTQSINQNSDISKSKKHFVDNRIYPASKDNSFSLQSYNTVSTNNGTVDQTIPGSVPGYSTRQLEPLYQTMEEDVEANQPHKRRRKKSKKTKLNSSRLNLVENDGEDEDQSSLV